jgi:hypothetical protein
VRKRLDAVQNEVDEEENAANWNKVKVIGKYNGMVLLHEEKECNKQTEVGLK